MHTYPTHMNCLCVCATVTASYAAGVSSCHCWWTAQHAIKGGHASGAMQRFRYAKRPAAAVLHNDHNIMSAAVLKKCINASQRGEGQEGRSVALVVHSLSWKLWNRHHYPPSKIKRKVSANTSQLLTRLQAASCRSLIFSPSGYAMHTFIA